MQSGCMFVQNRSCPTSSSRLQASQSRVSLMLREECGRLVSCGGKIGSSGALILVRQTQRSASVQLKEMGEDLVAKLVRPPVAPRLLLALCGATILRIVLVLIIEEELATWGEVGPPISG